MVVNWSADFCSVFPVSESLVLSGCSVSTAMQTSKYLTLSAKKLIYSLVCWLLLKTVNRKSISLTFVVKHYIEFGIIPLKCAESESKGPKRYTYWKKDSFSCIIAFMQAILLLMAISCFFQSAIRQSGTKEGCGLLKPDFLNTVIMYTVQFGKRIKPWKKIYGSGLIDY